MNYMGKKDQNQAVCCCSIASDWQPSLKKEIVKQLLEWMINAICKKFACFKVYSYH